jgi:molecular chaperone GrpE (heat shock protein)
MGGEENPEDQGDSQSAEKVEELDAEGELAGAPDDPGIEGESPGEGDEVDPSRSHELEEELRWLRRAFEDRFIYDETKEEAFRRLYTDLEHFKQVAAAYQFRPIYLDVILLLDRLMLLRDGQDSSSPCAAILESMQDELMEILARRGVTVVEATGDAFDPKCQRAVDVVTTSLQEMNHTVEKVLRPGYACDDSILRPADVVVRRFVASAETTEEEG